jgi:glutathione peroxidase
MSSFYDFEVKTIDGESIDLNRFKSQVVLVVNTASACGFTPQFKGLEELHKTYANQGLVVMGFPCNQFGAQDPGTNESIHTYCETQYGVTFPMMEKIEVNGSGAHPLYQWLKEQAPGILNTTAIKWNFTKFLIGRDGQVIDRFAPQATPESLAKDIELALAKA